MDDVPQIGAEKRMTNEQWQSYVNELVARARQPDATLTLAEIGVLALTELHARVTELERVTAEQASQRTALEGRVAELERLVAALVRPASNGRAIVH